jgi:hypothetical protein
MKTSEPSLLEALIKLVRNMLGWGIFLLLSPFILLGVLVFGIQSMSPDEIGLLKVLVVVIGPFAFTIWWIIVRHVSGGKSGHIRNFVVLIVSFVGSVYAAYLFHNASDRQFFFGAIVGIFSPVILIAAYKLLQKFA